MNKEPTSYITVNTRLPRYLPYPRFLLRAKLSQAAKQVYMMLFDRTTLSIKNGWMDEDGNIYIFYAVEHIAQDAGWSRSTAKRAVRELKSAGMIEYRRVAGTAAYRIYVKLPSEGSELTLPGGQYCTHRGVRNEPLTTISNKTNVNHMVTGSKMVLQPIPDYECEEGASL